MTGLQPGDTGGPWIIVVWYSENFYSKASYLFRDSLTSNAGSEEPEEVEAVGVPKPQRRRTIREEKGKRKKKAKEIPRVASLCLHLFITVAIYRPGPLFLQRTQEKEGRFLSFLISLGFVPV